MSKISEILKLQYYTLLILQKTIIKHIKRIKCAPFIFSLRPTSNIANLRLAETIVYCYFYFSIRMNLPIIKL